MKIILASGSAGRKQLLKNLGVEFEIVPSEVNEEKIQGDLISPVEIVREISAAKCLCVLEKFKYEDVTIIAADTVVFLAGKIFGKPSCEKDAISMLKTLRGKEHFVYTGVTVAVRKEGKLQTETFAETTAVSIKHISDDELFAYIKTKEPFGKAGAYGAQGIGAFLIERINGDYFNVVGLPVCALVSVLKKMGVGNLIDYVAEIQHYPV